MFRNRLVLNRVEVYFTPDDLDASLSPEPHVLDEDSWLMVRGEPRRSGSARRDVIHSADVGRSQTYPANRGRQFVMSINTIIVM